MIKKFVVSGELTLLTHFFEKLCCYFVRLKQKEEVYEACCSCGRTTQRRQIDVF